MIHRCPMRHRTDASVMILYMRIRAVFRISTTYKYICTSRSPGTALCTVVSSTRISSWTLLVSVVLHRHRRVALTSYRFPACTYDGRLLFRLSYVAHCNRLTVYVSLCYCIASQTRREIAARRAGMIWLPRAWSPSTALGPKAQLLQTRSLTLR